MEIFWTSVWMILVQECGASHDDMGFVNTLGHFIEWRFQGKLGFGGKVWHVNGDVYVNCYPEDRNGERDLMIERANARLAKLVQQDFLQRLAHRDRQAIYKETVRVSDEIKLNAKEKGG